MNASGRILCSLRNKSTDGDFPGGSVIRTVLSNAGAFLIAQLVKNLPAMQEDPGSIPGLGRSPGEGKGYPPQYSGLENSMGSIELDTT